MDIIKELYYLRCNKLSENNEPPTEEELAKDEEWIAYKNFLQALTPQQQALWHAYEDLFFKRNADEFVETYRLGFKDGFSLSCVFNND